MAQVLDRDVHSGITRLYEKNNDGTFNIRSVADVEGQLKHNQVKKNAQSEGWKGDMHEVADIPMIVWEQWWKEFGGNPMSKENRPRLIAKLNNSDFCKLRTKEGRI